MEFINAGLVAQIKSFSEQKAQEKQYGLGLVSRAAPALLSMDGKVLSSHWKTVVMQLPNFSHCEKDALVTLCDQVCILTFGISGGMQAGIWDACCVAILGKNPFLSERVLPEVEVKLNAAFFSNLYEAVANDCGIGLGVFKEILENG